MKTESTSETEPANTRAEDAAFKKLLESVGPRATELFRKYGVHEDFIPDAMQIFSLGILRYSNTKKRDPGLAWVNRTVKQISTKKKTKLQPLLIDTEFLAAA